MYINTENLIIAEVKQPNEVLSMDISFGKLHVLPSGATEITEAIASAVRWKRKVPDVKEDAESFLVSTTPTILLPNKTSVRIALTGGEHNYDYKVTVLVTFDNLSKLEREIFVRVREN